MWYCESFGRINSKNNNEYPKSMSIYLVFPSGVEFHLQCFLFSMNKTVIYTNTLHVNKILWYYTVLAKRATVIRFYCFTYPLRPK